MDKKKEQYEQALENKKKVKVQDQIEEHAKKFTPIRFKYKLLWLIENRFSNERPVFTGPSSQLYPVTLPYFHHGCDFVDDVGWGKGYRVLQMMCKYVLIQLNKSELPVPSIHDIQKILVKIGHKPKSFQRLKEPIGAKEAMLVIETLFNHKATLIETTGALWTTQADFINRNCNGFSMLSTDSDEDCRGICGLLYSTYLKTFFLTLVDPGCTEIPKDMNELQQKGCVYFTGDNEYDPEKKIYLCCVKF